MTDNAFLSHGDPKSHGLERSRFRDSEPRKNDIEDIGNQADAVAFCRKHKAVLTEWEREVIDTANFRFVYGLNIDRCRQLALVRIFKKCQRHSRGGRA
jgi:hypothetical protein